MVVVGSAGEGTAVRSSGASVAAAAAGQRRTRSGVKQLQVEVLVRRRHCGGLRRVKGGRTAPEAESGRACGTQRLFWLAGGGCRGAAWTAQLQGEPAAARLAVGVGERGGVQREKSARV